MVKNIALAVWMLVPVAGVAYRNGAGQVHVQHDRIAAGLNQAAELTAMEDWQTAADVLSEILKDVPTEDYVTKSKIQLEQAKLALRQGDLKTATGHLQTLKDGLSEHPTESMEFQREVTRVTANRDFYDAWMKRIEGAPQEEWQAVVELSRQQFRQLAESAASDEERLSRSQDNEAAIRLAQLDADDLGALPFPRECNCKSKGGALRPKPSDSYNKSQTPKRSGPSTQPGPVLDQLKMDVDNIGT